METIGLTGGIASGKSTVSSFLRERGAKIIDADAISHENMQKGNLAYSEIVEIFGRGILDDNLEINRAKLGGIVFSDKKRLDALVAASHKHVIDRTMEIIREAQTGGEYKFLVIDAPLLIESGLHRICTEVWLMYCEYEKRISRLCARGGMDRLEAEKRIAAQTPFEVLKPYASLIIDNNGSLPELRDRVDELLNVKSL